MLFLQHPVILKWLFYNFNLRSDGLIDWNQISRWKNDYHFITVTVSTFAAAPPLRWLCPGLLFERAGTLTLPLLHSTREGTRLRSSLHYQSQLPSANHCNVREGRRLLCVETSRPSTTQCLSLSVTPHNWNPEFKRYFQLPSYVQIYSIIKFVTESTHFGSNLEGILGYRICVCAQHNPLGENNRNHDTSVVSYLNEVAFCLWRLQIKFCNEISSCEDIRNNLVRGNHDPNQVIFCLNYLKT